MSTDKAEVFPPVEQPTGFTTRALNDPEREPDVEVELSLITGETPVLWKGAVG